MSETGGDGGGRRRGGLLDDLAGVAGGAFSALAGIRAEVEAMARSQAEAMVQRLELVRREELDAALEVARRAREGAEALEARVAALEARLAAVGGGGGAAAAGAAAAGAAAASPAGTEADAEEAMAPREAFEPPAGGGVSGEERTEASPGGI